MDTFDLIKSHIDAYTRKDGSVVQAHDDKRTKKQMPAAIKTAVKTISAGTEWKHSPGKSSIAISNHRALDAFDALGDNGWSVHGENEMHHPDGHRAVIADGALTLHHANAQGQEAQVEAHGVHGMKSKPWRKTFKSQKHFEEWMNKQDGNAEVHGVREIPHGH